jgi:coproporphyrinogen III oxidase-like Fe-S oxidoreductase
MQSAVPHVLATLDRTHEPAAVGQAVRAVREAGMAVSLDLIYGTPGESVEDWRRSLDAALSSGNRITCRPTRWSSRTGTRLAGSGASRRGRAARRR